MRTHSRLIVIATCVWVASMIVPIEAIARQQPPRRRPSGRISFMVDSWSRDDGDARSRQLELSTAITFLTPEYDGPGLEYGLNVRQSARPESLSSRLSIYDGYVGARFGTGGFIRVRAGHVWLPEMGTAGALAGGLAEFIQPRPDRERVRMRAGAFAGREPLVYQAGYAPNVLKMGGYFALEQGYMRRHIVGYTSVRQGRLIERSVLSLTNFVPIGRRAFVYQMAEFDVNGPAGGAGHRGLSYLVANARVTLAPRVEFFGSYNRGRSIDARTVTDDIRNGRPVTAQRLDGLLYESLGGRVTVEVARNIRVYGGYARDRNNRDDQPSGRATVGGHAGNLFGTGFDVSASASRISQATGGYSSSYVSVGRSMGQAIYLSVDYSTSLSVIRFERLDGVVIETHPWMRRLSTNASVTLGRRWSVIVAADYDRDESSTQFKFASGLSVRF